MNDLSGPSRWTPLIIASAQGRLNVVCILLQRQAQPDIQSRNGHTAFHMKCKENQSAVVRALLEKGADPTIVNTEVRSSLDVAANGIIQNVFNC